MAQNSIFPWKELVSAVSEIVKPDNVPSKKSPKEVESNEPELVSENDKSDSVVEFKCGTLLA